MKWLRIWKNKFLANRSYKAVALVVALIFWVMMMSERDAVVTQKMELQFLLKPNYAIGNDVRDDVEVEVAGRRRALKRFVQQEKTFTVDLSRVQAGQRNLKLTKEGLNLPIGVRLLSIRPETITVTIKRVAKGERKSD